VERYGHCVEKLAHGALGPEHVHRRMLPVLRQDRQLCLGLRAADSPDAPGQAPLIAKPAQTGLAAALWQLEPSRARPDPAHKRPPCADPPRQVEEHDRVCSPEPKIERRVVVAVGDPVIAGKQYLLLLAPRGLGRLGPARQPEVDVENNDGQAGLGRKRSRERALPRPGRGPLRTSSAKR
jgi:hypothetical protein